MRMRLSVDIPHEPSNRLVRAGTAGDKLGKILDRVEPLAVYFTEQDGRRGAVLVIEVASPSDVPRFAEPFFPTFNADCPNRFTWLSMRSAVKAATAQSARRRRSRPGRNQISP